MRTNLAGRNATQAASRRRKPDIEHELRATRVVQTPREVPPDSVAACDRWRNKE